MKISTTTKPAFSTSTPMTIIWLLCQLICFPIMLAVFIIKALYAIAKSEWNAYFSLFIMGIYILSCHYPILLAYLPISPLYLAITAISLPTAYITSNLLGTYRLTIILSIISIISISCWLSATSWLAPITLHTCALLLNALWWSTLTGITIAHNLYYSQNETLTTAEQQCIENHLLRIMVPNKQKASTPIRFTDYWHVFAIFSVQGKYEALLRQAEQAYVEQINNSTGDQKNFLLCKLIHVMYSNQLVLGNGEILMKRSLLPPAIRELAGDFYFYTLERQHETVVVFSGTSFLPHPCPSIFWSIIGNMTPGCSVGYPLLYLGKTTLQTFLKDPTQKTRSIRCLGFSMGGSFAKLAKLDQLFTDPEIDTCTYNAPGLLTWKGRACYTLTLALLCAAITSLTSYITTMSFWPPLLGVCSLLSLSSIAILSAISITCLGLFLQGEDQKILAMNHVQSFINAADCITTVAWQSERNIQAIYKWCESALETHWQSPLASG